MVKRLPATQETRDQFLHQEDPLEKEMVIHSNTLAWKIPWTEEPDKLQSMGSQRVGHNWATSLHFTSCCIQPIKLWLFTKVSQKTLHSFIRSLIHSLKNTYWASIMCQACGFVVPGLQVNKTAKVHIELTNHRCAQNSKSLSVFSASSG